MESQVFRYLSKELDNMFTTLVISLLLSNVWDSMETVYEVQRVQPDQPDRWAPATLLTDFVYPWEKSTAPATLFQALYDQDFFYFRFTTEDDDIYAPGDPYDKLGVLPSDRVEIFFKSQSAMDPYYCLEMDPRGRVLDYIARYYRVTDFKWEWPEPHLEVTASIQDAGYIVEGKISLSSLRELGILSPEGRMEAGLFRGDAYHPDKQNTDIKWISWIRPDSPKPDFHIPSAFGILKLVP